MMRLLNAFADLEDLITDERFRQQGMGAALLARAAELVRLLSA
jgi:GNAT superfamily N-acetyltransferase